MANANEDQMIIKIRNFAFDEAGAVTVDWVVLTAGLVSLGLAAMSVISDGTEDLSGDVDDKLQSQLISTTF